MSNCSQHKKDLFGESDMKKVAEAIGDLHYESLFKLLNHLAEKFYIDMVKDEDLGRIGLSRCSRWMYWGVHKASYGAERAWRISKPFMEDKKQM